MTPPPLLKVIAIAIAALSTSLAMAQGRWQLGNPSLVIDLPAHPSSGGVAWHETGAFSVLPTSWSAESGDLRVEIAEVYTAGNPQNLAAGVAQKLGGTLTNQVNGAVSGNPAFFFNIGPRSGVAVSSSGRGWIVLMTPKTSAGSGQMPALMRSMVLERWGNQRWVRRSLGGTKMNTELPFEMAPEPAEENGRRGFELHFDNYRVTASVASAEEEHKIDYEGTIKGFIEGEKKVAGTENFKSERRRVKQDRLEGDLVTLELKRGSHAYKINTFFRMDQGQLLRLSTTAYADNKVHDTYTDRILTSLQLGSVDLSNFEPKQVGSEGVWFDLPKGFDAPTTEAGSKNYNLFAGSFQVNVRVTNRDATIPYNADQLADFLEAKYKGKPNTSAFSADKSSKLIDGMESRVIKMKYKGKDRGDHTMVYAMAIFLPDRTIVAEMISEEQQSAYLDRIVDTARVELPTLPGWERFRIGDSGFSVLLGGKPEVERPAPSEARFTSLAQGVYSEKDLLVQIVEMQYKDNPPIIGLIMKEMAASLESTLKVESTLVDQQPIEVGSAGGVKARYEFKREDGSVIPVDLIVLRKGSFVWSLRVFYSAANESAAVKRALIINSIQ